jgi:hypothetical protein
MIDTIDTIRKFTSHTTTEDLSNCRVFLFSVGALDSLMTDYLARHFSI